MLKEINFSKDAEDIIQLIKNSKQNLFITGKAGTGKSTLLEYVFKIDPSFVVLAPTGIAAINVKGETIHSFFKLKPGYELDEAKHVRINNNMVALYAKVHTVIIDEISMVRADLLDAIDIFLQRVKKLNVPFGGVRMIFFGDLFQLPPVLLNNEKNHFLLRYKSPYFFSAHAFIQKDLFSTPFTLKRCELTTVYRQKNPVFTEILNKVRINSIESGDINMLNKQVKTNFIEESDEYLIKLVSTNFLAKNINQKKLELIDAEEIIFSAVSTGDIGRLEPNDSEVLVKIGAQIMFINNDPLKRWVNGSMGVIIDFKEAKDKETGQVERFLNIELESGQIVEVKQFTWEISKYIFKSGKLVRETIGAFTQIPIKLAWAITIHKSQGKTFNNVMIDLGKGSFVHGQTYVALSRCRKLENIVLAKPIHKSDIIVDNIVIEFNQPSS